MNRQALGAAAGISAAAMFGVSAPVAKRLLGETRPQLLAGLLYGGAALVLTAFMRARPNSRSPEARLRRSDGPLLAAITMLGGVLGPVLLLFGLERVSGVAGSLLLNLEAVLTMALALVVFGEHLDRRAAAGAAAVVGSAAVLGLGGGASRVDLVGVALVAGACACWAVDNNLTQRLSGRDPFAIVRAKATVAGGTNILLGLVLGTALPASWVVGVALLLGGAAYGLSVVLDAYALRWVGAAREAAFFGTAPAFGVATALVAFGEDLSAREGAATAVMALGIYLLVTERHTHEHGHVSITHDHRHSHDDGHHDHVHDEPVAEHAHVHTHAPIVHSHPHASDVHHRHSHAGGTESKPSAD